MQTFAAAAKMQCRSQQTGIEFLVSSYKSDTCPTRAEGKTEPYGAMPSLSKKAAWRALAPEIRSAYEVTSMNTLKPSSQR